jgi:hypothetical protein
MEMDPGSFLMFDLDYYRVVLEHRALVRSNVALVTDAAARANIAGVVVKPEGGVLPGGKARDLFSRYGWRLHNRIFN